MKLDLWNMFMSRLDVLDADVTLLTIVHSNDNDEIRFILESSSFNYPVFVDSLNTFGQQNNPPNDQLFQTFLLDTDDRVIALGNPVLNQQIEKLYRSIILGNNYIGTDTTTAITVDMPSRNIGVTHNGETVTTSFYLTNQTGNSVTVDTIVTSCDCTKASIKQPEIAPGTIASLQVTMSADSIPGIFQRQIQVYYRGIATPTIVQITGINRQTTRY